MDDQKRQAQNSSARDAAFDAFTKQIIADRLAAGDIDLKTMRFADMELFAHELGQRLARALGGPAGKPTWIRRTTTAPLAEGSARPSNIRARSILSTARRRSSNSSLTAPNVGGIFFPVRPQSGLDDRGYRPRVRQKILLAGTETHSDARAEVVLAERAEIPISSRHINRLTDEAGQKLREEQQERADRPARKSLPVEVNDFPELAVVEFDGGRIHTREPGHGPGTHAAAWKESKTALFLRMSSETHAEDPAPEPPQALLDRQNVARLAQEIAGAQALKNDGEEHSEVEADAASPEDGPPRYEPPKRLMRTCLASLDDSDRFGELMAAESAIAKAFIKPVVKRSFPMA